MEIVTAKTAGFCFGVKRAVDAVYEAINNGKKIATLGDIIHNSQVIDEVRLTKFGKALRKTSLDELPELFCILKGDMSIVGPRPLLVEYLPRYNEVQRRRHEVRPGLSGLAQVNGRNAISWEERFDWDVTYVDNITFIGDVKIILLTIWKAFVKEEGISAQGCATMGEFMGSAEKANV